MTPPDELALPGKALRILRRSLRDEVGSLPTIHALHTAGYESGEDLAADFLEWLGRNDVGSMPAADLWGRLEAFFVRRGWGRLEHRSPHPAIGILATSDWTEAEEAPDESQPTCAFTCGLLSCVLSSVADGPVAVLELKCRSRGDEECQFAFGAESVIHDLYGTLLDGADFEEALSRL